MRPKTFRLSFGLSKAAQRAVPPPGELKLIKGARPYLWVGNREGHCVGWLEGAALRDLAERIIAATDKAGEEDA